jgi:hypothetical protein
MSKKARIAESTISPAIRYRNMIAGVGTRLPTRSITSRNPPDLSGTGVVSLPSLFEVVVLSRVIRSPGSSACACAADDLAGRRC